MRRFLLKLTVAAMLLTLIFSMVTVSAASANIPKGTPTLDGVEEEMWKNASAKIPMNFSLAGLEDTNATGYARVMWDDKFLYCIGVIKDSTPTTGLKDPENPWFTDSFEVFLDEENKGTGDIPIAQFRVDTQGKFSGMLQHVTKDEAGMRSEYKDTKYAVKTNETGYVVEIAIPWTRIKPTADKTEIGLEFQINDEKDNSGYQDGKISSSVPNIWKCETYRNLVLSSKVVKNPEASKDNSTGTTSKNQTTNVTSKNQTTNVTSKNQTTNNATTSSKAETSSTQSDASTNSSASESEADVPTNTDTQANESNTNTDAKEDSKKPVSDESNNMQNKLFGVLLIVIIVCALAIVAVLVYVIVSNSKNRKVAKADTQEEDNND